MFDQLESSKSSVAFGGGASDDTAANFYNLEKQVGQEPSPSRLIHYKVSAQFQEFMRENGLVDEQSISTTELGLSVGNDGIVTIVFQRASTVSEEDGHVAINALNILTFDPDIGSLEDITNEVLADRVLNGVVRKMAIEDFNGDGVGDFAFALNSEDGRSYTNDVQTQVLMSSIETGQYEAIGIGLPTFTHNVQTFLYKDIGPLVVIDNIHNREGVGGYFYFSDRQFNALEMERPVFENGAVQDEIYFYNSGKLMAVGSYVLGLNERDIDGLAVGLALFEEDFGIFTLLDRSDEQFSETVWGKFGNTIRVDPAIEVEGEIARIAGYGSTETIELSESIYVVAKGTWIFMANSGEQHTLPNGDMVDVHVDGSRTIHYFDFFVVDDGKLNAVQAHINGKPIALDRNINFFDLMDINSDGIPDIVAYPIGGLPVIYLSSESFNYRELNVREMIDLGGEEEKFDHASYLARLSDLNGNGKLDLLYLQRDGRSEYMSEDFGIVLDVPILDNSFSPVFPNIYTGTNLSDIISTQVGDDLIIASKGADTIDGGAGIDRVSYDGSQNAYTVTLGSFGVQVLTCPPEVPSN